MNLDKHYKINYNTKLIKNQEGVFKWKEYKI